MNNDLIMFAHDLQTQVISTMGDSVPDTNNESKFTELFIDYLTEEGVLEDGNECFYKATGLQVNGYAVNQELGRVDLIVTNYTGITPPLTLHKSDVESHVRRAVSFYMKALNGLYNRLDKHTEICDLAQSIYEMRDSVSQVNIFFLTDGMVASRTSEVFSYSKELNLSVHIWDLERLHRSLTSGQRDEIEIDLTTVGGEIPCLPMQDMNDDYQSYLCIISGATLVEIYGIYGTRLLERNVRSFLQARGGVNKGIRKTIKTEPHMFMAYNNGISAVAEAVETVEIPGKGLCIKSLQGLQIVNGGQTTASIYHAYKKDKVALNGLNVQAKITVVSNKSKLDEMISSISLYANSQNKVQMADFSSNDPFHRTLEQLSRTVWAPTGHRQTKWYYERARGQFLDDRGKEPTLSYKREFDSIYPKSQKFTKIDLARFENTWNQMPYYVSRGGQKNFNEYTLWRSNESQQELDVESYKHIIALGILCKEIEKVITELKLGGYRSHTVDYVISYLSHVTNKGIDLTTIWREQGINTELAEIIRIISPHIRTYIINSSGNGNVTEWCKKKECWDGCKSLIIPIPSTLLRNV